MTHNMVCRHDMHVVITTRELRVVDTFTRSNARWQRDAWPALWLTTRRGDFMPPKARTGSREHGSHVYR